MKKTKIIPIAILIIMGLTRCYYDNVETLYPELPGACDTTNITYSKDISEIMSWYCTGCHGANASGGYDFRTYEAVKSDIDKIIGSMNHDNGFVPMPQGGNKLQDCILNKTTIWKQKGMPY